MSGGTQNREISGQIPEPVPASQQLSAGGIPASFDGMSGIGGQASMSGGSQFEDSQLDESQFEESLPPPKLSAWSQLDRVDFEASHDPAPQAHEDIIYNRSGNPVSRKDGSSLLLPPVEPPTRSKSPQAKLVATGGPSPRKAPKQSTIFSATKPTTSAAARQPGDYDPADDRIRFDAPIPLTPGAHQSGTTGPRLILPKGVRPRAPSPIYISDEESPEGDASALSAAPLPVDSGLQPDSQLVSVAADMFASLRNRLSPVPSAAAYSQSMPPPPPPLLPQSTGPVLGATSENPLILSSPSQPSDAGSQADEEDASLTSPEERKEVKDYHHAGYYVTPGTGLTPPREDTPLVPAAPDTEPPVRDLRIPDAKIKSKSKLRRSVSARASGMLSPRGFSLLDDDDAPRPTHRWESLSPLDEQESISVRNHLLDERSSSRPRELQVQDTPRHRISQRGMALASQASLPSEDELLGERDRTTLEDSMRKRFPPNQQALNRDLSNVSSVMADDGLRRVDTMISLDPRQSNNDALPTSALQTGDSLGYSNSVLRSQAYNARIAIENAEQEARRVEEAREQVPEGSPTKSRVQASLRKAGPSQESVKRRVPMGSPSKSKETLGQGRQSPRQSTHVWTEGPLTPTLGRAAAQKKAAGQSGSAHDTSSSSSNTFGKKVFVGGTPSQSLSDPSQQSDLSQRANESSIVVAPAEEDPHGNLIPVSLRAGQADITQRSEVDVDQVIPETQFSQDVVATTSHPRSPVILYSRKDKDEQPVPTQESQSQPTVKGQEPRVLVPASAPGASAPAVDDRGTHSDLSRNTSIVVPGSQTDESQPGVVKEGKEKAAREGEVGRGENKSADGQDPEAPNVQSTSNEKQSGSKETGSYEFSDPKATAQPGPPPKPAPSSPKKRTRDDDQQGDGDKRGAKRAKVDRARSKTPAVQKGPTSGKSKPLQTLPPPPPRPDTAEKPRQKSVAPTKEPVTPIQRARPTDDYISPSGILDFSSSLTPLPDTSAGREPQSLEISPAKPKEKSPKKGKWKTYRHGRTLVTEFVAPASENQDGASGADPDNPATQDPFKSLAKTTKEVVEMPLAKEFDRTPSPEPVKRSEPVATRRVTRSQSQAKAESQPTRPLPKGRKRSIHQSQADERIGTQTSTIPLPAKRARKGAGPILPTIAASPEASPKRTTVQHLQPTGRLDVACQSGGRVFAPLKKMYMTATVVEYQQKAERVKFKGKGKAKATSFINCKVKFDDGTWEEIPLTELRRCELREGDELRIPGKRGAKLARTGHVSAVPSWIQRNTVSVRTTSKPKEEVTVVQGKDIGVPLEVIERDWDDRRVPTVEDIGLGEELIRAQEKERAAEEAKGKGKKPKSMTLGPPKWKDSPPPPAFRERSISPPLVRKRTTPATGRSKKATASSSARRVSIAPSASAPQHDARLAGFAFIFALAFRDADGNKISDAAREKKKNGLVRIITRHGGRVVDDGFDSLFQLGGQTSDDGARWIWNKGDMFFPDDSKAAKRKVPHSSTSSVAETKVERYMLLADGVNRNQKYMLALAMGIPCVNTRWIEDEAMNSWRMHVLPAGTYTKLGLICAQWIDGSYVDHPRSLRDMHENPGTLSRPFKDKSLLFVYPSKAKDDVRGVSRYFRAY
ncbi:hypothetical protein PIIN_03701 [Serendipita indica DSM 11827]|uniref:BRCT domain-containing protein n=1 Tax=Serendipita indica (strain DSM 11827) TaxID=1109443 RepID=G4TEL8_SERID|nr:hypothetical protein PIIN_03701 [Serendipita indica DSM 11827]